MEHEITPDIAYKVIQRLLGEPVELDEGLFLSNDGKRDHVVPYAALNCCVDPRLPAFPHRYGCGEFSTGQPHIIEVRSPAANVFFDGVESTNFLEEVKHAVLGGIEGHTDCGGVTAAYNTVTQRSELPPCIRNQGSRLLPLVERGTDYITNLGFDPEQDLDRFLAGLAEYVTIEGMHELIRHLYDAPRDLSQTRDRYKDGSFHVLATMYGLKDINPYSKPGLIIVGANGETEQDAIADVLHLTREQKEHFVLPLLK